jgi:hypothetical protein
MVAQLRSGRNRMRHGLRDDHRTAPSQSKRCVCAYMCMCRTCAGAVPTQFVYMRGCMSRLLLFAMSPALQREWAPIGERELCRITDRKMMQAHLNGQVGVDGKWVRPHTRTYITTDACVFRTRHARTIACGVNRFKSVRAPATNAIDRHTKPSATAVDGGEQRCTQSFSWYS